MSGFHGKAYWRVCQGDKKRMSGFYGKAYWYKGKIIGVCPTLSDELFMIGHVKSSGSYQRSRIREFKLYSSSEEAQKCLDEFAVSRGLSEVKSW